MIEVEGALLRLQEQFQKVSTTPTEMYPSIYVHTYPSPSPAPPPAKLRCYYPARTLLSKWTLNLMSPELGLSLGRSQSILISCAVSVWEILSGAGVFGWGAPGFRDSGVPGSRWTWGSLIVFSRLRSVRFMRLGMPTRSPGRAIKSYKLKLHAYVATSTSNYPTAGVKDTVPNRDRTSLHIP